MGFAVSHRGEFGGNFASKKKHETWNLSTNSPTWTMGMCFSSVIIDDSHVWNMGSWLEIFVRLHADSKRQIKETENLQLY